MANVATYDAGGAGIVSLKYPLVTIAHVIVPSAAGLYTQSVRIIYTIRALIQGSSANDLDYQIRLHKQVLSVSGGTLILDRGGKQSSNSILTADAASDISQGPHPRSLEITRQYGGKTALVIWQLETERHVAENTSAPEWAWIDFIYTIQTSIDENLYQTRQISGLLRIAPNHPMVQGIDADHYRTTVENVLANYRTWSGTWQVISRDYRLSEDRQSLIFTLTFRQVYCFLPPDIRSGEISMTTEFQPGGRGRISLYGYLEASPNRSRPQVANTAFQDINAMFYNMVLSQIAFDTWNGSTQEAWHLEQERCRFTVHYHSNRFEFQVDWLVLGAFMSLDAPQSFVQTRGVDPSTYYVLQKILTCFGVMSQAYGALAIDSDQGPYTELPVAGLGDANYAVLPLTIDLASRTPQGWTTPTPGVGSTEPGAPSAESLLPPRTIYVSWQCRFEYKIDYGYRFFPVMMDGVQDIIQKVRANQIYLTVHGSAKSKQQPPAVQVPGYSFSDVGGGTIPSTNQVSTYVTPLQWQITPFAPDEKGIYRTDWFGIFKLVNPEYINGSSELLIPYNPMLADGIQSTSEWQNINGALRLPHIYVSL